MDVEYNREGEAREPKQLGLDAACANRLDLQGRAYVVPDLIVHQRGPAGPNLFLWPNSRKPPIAFRAIAAGPGSKRSETSSSTPKGPSLSWRPARGMPPQPVLNGGMGIDHGHPVISCQMTWIVFFSFWALGIKA